MAYDNQNIELDNCGPIAFKERRGDGMPLIFLHGAGFSSAVFDHHFKSLDLRNRWLIAIDLPGHGQSANAKDPRSDYSYAGLARSVFEFFQRRDVPPCLLVGWSMGGHIAYEMMADPNHQKYVAAVAAFSAPPVPTNSMGLIQGFQVTKNLLLAGKATFNEQDAIAYENAMLNGVANGQFTADIQRVDREFRPALRKNMLRGNDVNHRSVLENTNTPFSMFHGANDAIVRTSSMTSFRAQSLAGGRSTQFTNCGHAPFLESPTVTEVLLLDFAHAVENGTALKGSDEQLPIILAA